MTGARETGNQESEDEGAKLHPGAWGIQRGAPWRAVIRRVNVIPSSSEGAALHAPEDWEPLHRIFLAAWSGRRGCPSET